MYRFLFFNLFICFGISFSIDNGHRCKKHADCKSNYCELDRDNYIQRWCASCSNDDECFPYYQKQNGKCIHDICLSPCFENNRCIYGTCMNVTRNRNIFELCFQS